jgi:hypothetical protein
MATPSTTEHTTSATTSLCCESSGPSLVPAATSVAQLPLHSCSYSPPSPVSGVPPGAGMAPSPPPAPEQATVPVLLLSDAPLSLCCRVTPPAWVSRGMAASTEASRWSWRSGHVFMVVTMPRSWSSFTESDVATGSLSNMDMEVNASRVSDTKLIRPLCCGVRKDSHHGRIPSMIIPVTNYGLYRSGPFISFLNRLNLN